MGNISRKRSGVVSTHDAQLPGVPGSCTVIQENCGTEIRGKAVAAGGQLGGGGGGGAGGLWGMGCHRQIDVSNKSDR